MIWAQFHKNAHYEELASAVNKAMQDCIVTKDKKKQKQNKLIPHITIARLCRLQHDHTIQIPIITLPPLLVASIHLMESLLHQNGAKYSLLETFPATL